MLSPTEVRDLSDRLTSAHAVLIDATRAAQSATQGALTARLSLKTAEQGVISKHADDPKALGANEAARAAKIADLTLGERVDLFDAEHIERNAEAARKVAELQVRAIQDELKALQLLASLTAATV